MHFLLGFDGEAFHGGYNFQFHKIHFSNDYYAIELEAFYGKITQLTIANLSPCCYSLIKEKEKLRNNYWTHVEFKSKEV